MPWLHAHIRSCRKTHSFRELGHRLTSECRHGLNGRATAFRGRSIRRLFRKARYAFPGTRDGGDEAALAPKASDSWSVLAHLSGESVPRAWRLVPVCFTEAFWTRSSLSPRADLLTAFPSSDGQMNRHA